MPLRTFKTVVLFLMLFTVNVFSDNGPNHQRKQGRPIRLGTSGGNTHDKTSKFCCSGTLGALVKDGSGTRYILSNNHVLAKSNKASLGDPISQPGLIDSNCFSPSGNIVGHLSQFAQIRFSGSNTVDAALAEIVRGTVNRRGKILDIGRPGHAIEPSVGMIVKKSGRTTGKTTGKIVAINVSVSVEMPRHCGDNNGKRARFVDQFIVNSTSSGHFIDSGDSGALVVKNRRTCPQSVGLVFAGDNKGNATANRISNVLSIFQVNIVGCSASTTSDPASATELTRLNSAVIQAEAIRQRHEEELFRIPGVVGVGIGAIEDGSAKPAIALFVQKNSATAISSSALPKSLDQVRVRVFLTSGFKAM